MARILFHIIKTTIRLLPEKVALYLADVLGFIWFYLLPIRKKLVIEQLTASFSGKMSADEIHRIARNVFTNQCRNLIEFLRIDPNHPENILDKIEVEGQENLDKAQKCHKGVLVLTAHIGNYDLLACSQALSGAPLVILSKTIKPTWLNNYWMQTRTSCGMEILPTKGVKEKLLEKLAQGKVIGFIFDQKMNGPKAIEVPFFGKNCWTTPGLAQLAILSEAPVLPVFIYRTLEGKHRTVIGSPLKIPSSESFDKRVLETTRIFQIELEKTISKHPDQWLWMHRRWAERR